MIKKKLQWKLVLFICLIAVCLVIPIGLFLNIQIEQYHFNQFEKGIQRGFSTLRFFEEETLDVYDVYIEMRDIYSGAFDIYGDNRSFTILDRRTNQVYSSDVSYIHKEDDAFIVELYGSDNFIEAVSGEMGNQNQLVTIGDNAFYDYARSMGNLVFYFRYYKADWQPMVSEFNSITLTILLLSLILSFVIGFGVSKAITRPIQDITEKTKRIAGGHFEESLEKVGNDEIGVLTGSINEMSKSLQNMLDEISNEKNKIEIIMNNMNEGIIAFDKKGTMIHINQEALYMLDREEMNDQLDDFFKEYKIGLTQKEIIEDVQKANGQNIHLKLKGTIIGLDFALVMGQEKRHENIIVILRDITEQEKLEKMRKEFVANVSHELKTPLTSIKSYSETLLSGVVEDEETREKFLNVIDHETVRMSNLVRDLLQLSAIDMDRLKIHKNRYSVRDFVERTVEKVEIEATKKNQTITTGELFEGKAPFDYDKIQQVLINLLSNAIKYTEQEGNIHITTQKEGDFLKIIVQDDGVGIPEKDLAHVFDRFYRVDKGRSRKMGGTGLGLAIAKEIMLAHKGDIYLESKMNYGTKAVMVLPLIYIGGNQ